MTSCPDLCDLCGLPLRSHAPTTTLSGKTYRFCCLGCRQVFQMLSNLSDGEDPDTFKETDLFKKCRDIGIIPQSEKDLLDDRRQVEDGPNDSGPFTARLASDPSHPQTENSLHIALKVDGMWCPACAWVIEATLEKTAGIVSAACSFSTDRIMCSYNPVSTNPTTIIRTIDNLGYRSHLPDDTSDALAKKSEMLRLIIAAGLTLNIMMFSFALYTGFFTDFDPETVQRFSWPIFLMSSVVLFYGGRDIFRRALTGILHTAYGMETLIGMGALSAYLYSIVNMVSGSLHLYFDTTAMLITLVLLGKMLESSAKQSAQADLANFLSLQPTKVRICSEQDPAGRYVSAQQLRAGDIFLVEESEIIPADGRVVEGTGYVNESSLSGEARPCVKKTGDLMRSGTQVVQGYFRIEATAVGQDATLGQMIRIMEKTLAEKTPLEERTDRILRWFVPAIILLAVGTALVCRSTGLSVEASFIRAITVLVIACPCALGIAIPMARVAGISRANRIGILVRNFKAFERAPRIDAFVFDKTGTLTQGQWELHEVELTGSLSERQVLSLALSLEEKTHHPIAAAIRERADTLPDYSIMPHGIEAFENGVSGRIGEGDVRFGSKDFLSAEVSASSPLPDTIDARKDPSQSSVYMSIGGKICATFIFGDKIKVGTESTLAQLADMGISVSIVSGDNQTTTRKIGEIIGCSEATGSMLPGDKVAYVKNLQQKGFRVAMVGDGVNDAPALAQSDLSIAVYGGSGSHLNKERADITLMGGELNSILEFWQLASAVGKKVHQNLVCAFLYNAICLPLAMGGTLTPLIAVSAMLLSSLSVIANTLLLTRHGH